MKFTGGSRIERWEHLKAIRPYIEKSFYEAEKAKLEKEQKKANAIVAAERRAERVEARREAKRVAKAEAARVRREAKKAERLAKKVSNVVFDAVIPVGADESGPEVYAIAQAMFDRKAKDVKMEFFVNGVMKRDMNVQIQEPNMEKPSRLHREIMDAHVFYRWQGGSDAPSIFVYNKVVRGKKVSFVKHSAGDVLRVKVTLREAPKPKRMTQAFRDGSVYCVIDPLIAMFEEQIENSKSKDSKKRLSQRIGALEAIKAQYPMGVPEGEPMEELAKKAGRHIIIKDFVANDALEYNKTARDKFHFVNTRENHVEAGAVCIGEKPVIVSESEFAEIVQKHLKDGVWFCFDGPNDAKRCLRSRLGAWKIHNELHDIYERHNNANSIGEFGFDAIKNPAVNAFLKKSVVINSTPLKLSDEIATGHRDLKAAYTQHQRTGKYFRGFLGKIQQHRDVSSVVDVQKFMEEHIGIYEFKVMEIGNALFGRLGFEVGHRYILPSVEVLFYMDHGMKVQILNAVLGSCLPNIEYSDEMMETKAYQTWAGCLSHDKAKKEYNFIGSYAWAEHLAFQLGRENVRWNGDSITVYVDKKINYTKHHLLAFITAYTRINVIEALMPLQKPCMVLLDGIYYADEDSCWDYGVWREKPIAEHQYYCEAWFEPVREVYAFPPLTMEFLNHCMLAGQGGSGKTYSIMNDIGFFDVLMVVPQHSLGRAMGARYATIHRMIGLDASWKWCEKYVTPAVILLDELTMNSAEWIVEAMRLYKHTLFLIAGDVAQTEKGFMWFQCRNGKPGAFSAIFEGKGLNWKYYLEDRRAQDDALKALKVNLRREMVNAFIDGGAGDSHEVMRWVCDTQKIVKFDDAVGMFSHGDTWIAGTHRTNEKLLQNGIVSGYLCKSADNKNARSLEEVSGWEKRGSFTTHSFQGQTVRDGRIFISINDAFEHAMIYTAVSRAVSFSQIVFVL